MSEKKKDLGELECDKHCNCHSKHEKHDNFAEIQSKEQEYLEYVKNIKLLLCKLCYNRQRITIVYQASCLLHIIAI